jgi:hypothetical protein
MNKKRISIVDYLNKRKNNKKHEIIIKNSLEKNNRSTNEIYRNRNSI